MTDPEISGSSVMARKLAAASGSDAGSDHATLRALRLSLSRAAQDSIGLSAAVIGVRQSRQEQESLAGELPESWLAILLDGPGDQPGAICLDPGFVTGIIQHQTIGSVLAGPVADRRFTATDAAMTGPLIDTMLEQAESLIENPADQLCFCGFRFGARVAETADLLLSLSAETYRQFHLTIDLSGGASQGKIRIILPDQQVPVPIGGPEQQAQSGPSLENAFDGARADLMAVLCRLRVSLADFSDLRAGDLIPIQGGGFDQTELVAINGETVAICRLGQMSGMRAIRANETVETQVPDSLVDDEFSSSITRRTVLPETRKAPAPKDPVPVPAVIETTIPEEIDLNRASQDLTNEISRLAGFSGAEIGALEVDVDT